KTPLIDFEKRVGDRLADMMAADPASLLARAFYMLARDQPTEELSKVLRVLVESLNLSDDQRELVRKALPDLFDRYQHAKELEQIELARMGLEPPAGGQLEFFFDSEAFRAPTLGKAQIEERAERC